MPADRYYFSASLRLNEQIILEGAEAHHLSGVMRGRRGDAVEIVNGRGELAFAEVTEIEKKRVQLTILKVVIAEPAKKRLILAQALPKMNRLEIIIEKATELGIDEIWLFPGKQSEKQEISPNQTERMQGILISAMKQCGRLFLPKIELRPPLKKWETIQLPAFFGDLREGVRSFVSFVKQKQANEGLLFLIGPESGFDDDEVRQMEKLGAEGVKLHENILRTDTAAIAACCMMSQLFLDEEKTLR